MSRRADRLFRLIAELRGRRLAVTGAALAEALEVSPRTVYRDVADLQASGVPITGEAGVGYRLDPGFELPPIMFTRAETLALLTGAAMVRAFTDPGMAAAAESAETKIRAILDDAALKALDEQPYRIPLLSRDTPLRITHQQLREAIFARRKLTLAYEDATGACTSRTVWPLGLMGWTGRWTLLAWCETREDYRNFRLDRITAMAEPGGEYPVRADRSLSHYLTSLDHTHS
ncbi:helix-turn-helix transcriptional regulator [Algicella marina]|uniref:helix-turn-helix transcriptional regulator n=1 Tax=Algicella marina TaxID=2683284 RepID=UPI0024DFEAF0|nr:YafY family protein [Algicella marina]